MVSLYLLRDFFKSGRKPNGGFMGENEDMNNATQRNLSLCSDAELLELRDSAALFIKEVEAAYQERQIDDEREAEDESERLLAEHDASLYPRERGW